MRRSSVGVFWASGPCPAVRRGPTRGRAKRTRRCSTSRPDRTPTKARWA